MKNIFKIIPAILLVIVTLYSCSDNEIISMAKVPADGEFLISSSTGDIILDRIDSDTQTAITFNWDRSWYGIDTPSNYTLEIDKATGDFSAPITAELIDNQKSYTHAELNSIALGLELVPDAVGQIQVRLKVALNYEALPVYSQVASISVTPYAILDLMYPLPGAIYLQGDAVASNWGYPIPSDQQLSQMDDHRFGLIVALTGSKSFSFITSPDMWSDPAYKAATDNEPLTGGDFIPSGSNTDPPWGGADISSPVDTGIYKVIIDFTEGTYSVAPEAAVIATPDDLYIVGDAAPLGWDTGPSQKFTKDGDTFTLTIDLTEGGVYAFITALSWSDPAFLAKTGSEPLLGGNFIASGAANGWGGSNFTAPTTGTYLITVNFKSGTYILTL